MSTIEVILSAIIGTVFLTILFALLFASLAQARREQLMLRRERRVQQSPREDWYLHLVEGEK